MNTWGPAIRLATSGAVARAKRAGAGDAGDPFADVGLIDTEVGEDLSGDSIAFSQDSEQQVLAAGVRAVLEFGVAEHFLRPRGECQRAGARLLRPAADDPCHGGPGLLLVGASTGEDPRGHTVPGGQQAEQDVLGAQVVVLQRSRFVLGEQQHLTGIAAQRFGFGICNGPACFRRVNPSRVQRVDLVPDAF
jgi:hypothetical protein